ALNAALESMTYTPPSGFHGNAELNLGAQSYGATPLQGQLVITDGLFLVTTTADGGPGSLRQAILDSNMAPGARNTFDVYCPGPGVHTIAPTSPLPTITASVLIDGFSQPGSNGTPWITLDIASSGNPEGLTVAGAEVTISGIANTRFALGSSTRAA